MTMPDCGSNSCKYAVSRGGWRSVDVALCGSNQERRAPPRGDGMTDEMIALSRRAVACPKWRWMPGMLAHFEHDGRRVRVGMPDAWASTTALPDLTDSATRGCLLTLVREAWGCVVVTSPDYDEDEVGCQGHNIVGWRAVETVRWMPVGEGKTEAEALIYALESAP